MNNLKSQNSQPYVNAASFAAQVPRAEEEITDKSCNSLLVRYTKEGILREVNELEFIADKLFNDLGAYLPIGFSPYDRFPEADVPLAEIESVELGILNQTEAWEQISIALRRLEKIRITLLTLAEAKKV